MKAGKGTKEFSFVPVFMPFSGRKQWKNKIIYVIITSMVPKIKDFDHDENIETFGEGYASAYPA